MRNINEMYTIIDELYNEMSLTVAGVNLKIKQASSLKIALCRFEKLHESVCETLES